MTSTTLPIRVLIADDHCLFRRGLRQICEIMGGFAVVGEAANGQEAITLARQVQPDVILMDINMPVLDGVQATSFIMEQQPMVKVIILTMYRQDNYVFEAVKAGARGYLLKDIDEQELIETVRAVYRGEALINPALAARLLDEFRRIQHAPAQAETPTPLNPGEMAVLRLVAQGEDNQAIAAHLTIAESTVANRLNAIFQKLHVNNRTQAALAALRQGWASLN